MAWLVRDATVLASVEVADTFAARCRGLLRRDGIDGALLLRPARSVHTLGMRFPIDVAHCDGDLRVLHITRMRPYRIGRPFRRAYVIIEAEAGAFERWGLRVGDELALHGEESGPPGAGPGPGRLLTVGARLRAWGRHRSPGVSVGAGTGGRDGAPLVGSSNRAVAPGETLSGTTRPPEPRQALYSMPSRLAAPTPAAALTPQPATPSASASGPRSITSSQMSTLMTAAAGAAGAAGPADAPGSSERVEASERVPSRRRVARSRRVPLPVACW